MQHHICKYCKVNKPASEYRVHKRGYRIGKCRECEREYQRAWSRRDPAKYRLRKRESMARRRAEDPEAARRYSREYHANNCEKQTAKMRDYYTRRFFWARSMKLRGPGKASFRELASLWRRQRGVCAMTGLKLDRLAQLDHILPKARGGGDEIANLRWVRPEVNLAKRDLTDEEFVNLCRSVMRWIGERIAFVDSLSELS